MTTILDTATCQTAGASLSGNANKGFRFDQPAGGYSSTGSDRARGCTLHGGSTSSDLQLFPTATGNCGEANFHCICKSN
jgi:hypothetical protein